MKDWANELTSRVAFLRQALDDSGAKGFVYGNSGGKDSALVGILCRMATPDTIGVMMPVSTRNHSDDIRDGMGVADMFGIQTRTIPLKDVHDAMALTIEGATELTPMAKANIAPRLRMTVLYAIAGAENRLVVGTGNRSEAFMGYFTKWGDGAHDINPIADLTVTEVYAFLRCLDVSQTILTKAPSAALFDGQTDEGEMGISYADIDRYLISGEVDPSNEKLIHHMHEASNHKRCMPLAYEAHTLL